MAFMHKQALLEILARGEDSHHQFKQDFSNTEALSCELVAFANTKGGRLFVGVDDNGTVTGLRGTDVSRLNQLLSNAASQGVKPPVNPISCDSQSTSFPSFPPARE